MKGTIVQVWICMIQCQWMVNDECLIRAELSDNVSLTTWFEFYQSTCDIIRKEKKTFRAELTDNVSLTTWFEFYQSTRDIIRKEKKRFEQNCQTMFH